MLVIHWLYHKIDNTKFLDRKIDYNNTIERLSKITIVYGIFCLL